MGVSWHQIREVDDCLAVLNHFYNTMPVTVTTRVNHLDAWNDF